MQAEKFTKCLRTGPVEASQTASTADRPPKVLSSRQGGGCEDRGSSTCRWDSGSLEKRRHLPKVIERASYDNKESLQRQKPLTGYQEEVRASLKKEWKVT